MANKNIDGDVNVQFTEASSRQSLESGESVKTLFGKLRKWLSDLKPVAFSGSYNDLTDKTMTGYTKPASTSAITTSDTINEAIGKLEKGLEDAGGGSSIASWGELQNKVRNGTSMVRTYEQFGCNRGNDVLVWDVIGINHDTPTDPNYSNSLTLRLHDQYPFTRQFDAPEAMYYCENDLPPGDYYYSIVSSGNTHRYYFTLTKTVPAGGQLTIVQSKAGSSTVYYIYSYESATSLSFIEKAERKSGSRGTLLGTVGDGVVNTEGRFTYGNGNYKESAIRQWLNSDKPVGEWWTPQNKWDRPPSDLASQNGFMYGLDRDFLAAVGKTRFISNGEELEDYFFLHSASEISVNYKIEEGERYDYYINYPTGTSPTKTYREGAESAYYLRSGSDSSVYYVNTSGSTYSSGSSATIAKPEDLYGIIIVCNII